MFFFILNTCSLDIISTTHVRRDYFLVNTNLGVFHLLSYTILGIRVPCPPVQPVSNIRRSFNKREGQTCRENIQGRGGWGIFKLYCSTFLWLGITFGRSVHERVFITTVGGEIFFSKSFMASFFAIRRPVLFLIGIDVYQTKIRGNNAKKKERKEKNGEGSFDKNKLRWSCGGRVMKAKDWEIKRKIFFKRVQIKTKVNWECNRYKPGVILVWYSSSFFEEHLQIPPPI